MTKAQLNQTIAPYLNGLFFISECDSEVKAINLNSPDIEGIHAELARKHGTSADNIQIVDAAAFFNKIEKNASASDTKMVEYANKFKSIYTALMQNSKALSVYRVEGNVQVPVYIAAQVNDGCFCLTTISVES